MYWILYCALLTTPPTYSSSNWWFSSRDECMAHARERAEESTECYCSSLVQTMSPAKPKLPAKPADAPAPRFQLTYADPCPDGASAKPR